MLKKFKRDLYVHTNTDILPTYFWHYNDRIRYCRRTFSKSYYYEHLKWWGVCKICKIETTKKHYNNFICVHCLKLNNKK
jgi:hypothetical protein